MKIIYENKVKGIGVPVDITPGQTLKVGDNSCKIASAGFHLCGGKAHA